MALANKLSRSRRQLSYVVRRQGRLAIHTPLVRRLYLLLSAAILLVTALTYGVAPTTVLPQILEVTVTDRDLIHIFRAVMGLYLALAILWGVAAFVPRLVWTAILSEVVVTAGLASGRVVSLLIDGWPSNFLAISLLVEVAMAVAGITLLGQQSSEVG